MYLRIKADCSASQIVRPHLCSWHWLIVLHEIRFASVIYTRRKMPNAFPFFTAHGSELASRDRRLPRTGKQLTVHTPNENQLQESERNSNKQVQRPRPFWIGRRPEWIVPVSGQSCVCANHKELTAHRVVWRWAAHTLGGEHRHVGVLLVILGNTFGGSFLERRFVAHWQLKRELSFLSNRWTGLMFLCSPVWNEINRHTFGRKDVSRQMKCRFPKCVTWMFIVAREIGGSVDVACCISILRVKNILTTCACVSCIRIYWNPSGRFSEVASTMRNFWAKFPTPQVK